ncbi:MAG TPA: YCF48-related protein, partial [Phycisphaerales bacterium]|nr:YCF48-related protein [Phycisphaerales bacterium]
MTRKLDGARIALAAAGLSWALDAGSARGQQWERQSPTPADDHLYNVHFTDAESGWAVGHDGIVLRTADGGDTWQQHPSFPRHWYLDNPVRHLQFVDAQHGFAGGDNVYRTADGGQTWQDMGYHGTAGRMEFISAQIGFISGNSGLRRTADGGQTFETIGERADVAFVDATTGVYVLQSGVFRSTDAGETWGRISSTALSLAAYLSADVLIGVHNDHTLPGDHMFFRSADGGATWEEVFSDNTYAGSRYVTDVERIDADSVAAVDVNGGIWVSDDAGLTWAKTQEQIGEFFSATVEAWGLHFPTPSVGYAAGGPGVILKTMDGGHTWSMLSSGAAFDLMDIDMRESGFGVAVGDDLGVLRTNDFGRTWIPSRADTVAYSDFHAAQIIDEDTVVACGIGEAWDPADAPAVFYRSDDGGRTWERRGEGIFPETAWIFEDVHFVDEDHGWLFGQTLTFPVQPAVFATSDGGLTWTRADNGSIGFPLDGQMHDTQRGWFTSGGTLWVTQNGWLSTTTREYPVALGNVNDLEFIDEDTGWMLGRWGEVLRTDDNGQNFEHQTLPGFDPEDDLAFDLRALNGHEAAVATYHADVDGEWGRLYRTTDGGATWVPLQLIDWGGHDMSGRIYSLDAFAGGGIWAASSEDGFIWAAEVPSACAADFNGDGVVDTRDVLAFLNTWNTQGDGADFNGD